jgi:hypothetical protein
MNTYIRNELWMGVTLIFISFKFYGSISDYMPEASCQFS